MTATSRAGARASLEVLVQGSAVIAGLRVAGRLERCLADRIDRPSRVGAIVAARVLRRSRRTGGGALVLADLGDGRPAPVAASADLVPGAAVWVEITADPRDGKAAEATADPALAGRWLVHRPRGRGLTASARLDPAVAEPLSAVLADRLGDGGWVLRRAAADADPDAILAEAAALAARWRDAETLADPPPGTVGVPAPSPVARLLADHPTIGAVRAEDTVSAAWLRASMDDAVPALSVGRTDLAAELLDLLAAEQEFGEDGRLSFEATRGFMAVDVDAAALADPLRVNLAAVSALARALRLRNIGGLVAVDLLKLTRAADRRRVLARLAEALADDPETVRVGAISPLGLLDLTRRRRGPRLDEVVDGAAVRRVEDGG